MSKPRYIPIGEGTYVRPVERRTPARKAETRAVSCELWSFEQDRHTKDRIEGVVDESTELREL